MIRFRARTRVQAMLNARISTTRLCSVLVTVAKDRAQLANSQNVVNVVLNDSTLVVLVVVTRRNGAVLANRRAYVLRPTNVLRHRIMIITLFQLRVQIAVGRLRTYRVGIRVRLLRN